MTNKSTNEIYFSININVNYILTCLFVILAIIGISGNALVIISVKFHSNMKQCLTNRLIVHIACCDLIILLFNIPDLVQFVSSTNGNWLLNEISCKLIRSILVLAQYASVLTMCVVTIERFIGIVYPLRSKFLSERKNLAQITFLVWFFSLIFASPNLIYLRVIEYSPTRRSCLLKYSNNNHFSNQRGYIIHKSLESTIFYFIPLFIQLYSYTRIIKQLVRVDQTLETSIHLSTKRVNPKQKVHLNEDQCQRITRSSSLMPSSSEIEDYRQRATSIVVKYIGTYNKPRFSLLKRREVQINSFDKQMTYKTLKSRRSVIKMLSVVVIIYFISFSPQVLVFILFDTNAIRSVPKFIQTHYFIAFTMLLVTISSASNPIVYAIFSSKFRKSFKSIIQKLFCCHSTRFNYYQSRRSTNI